MQISDLLKTIEQNIQLTTHLTLRQEQELVSDTRLITSLLIAMRPWGVNIFESLRKKEVRIF